LVAVRRRNEAKNQILESASIGPNKLRNATWRHWEDRCIWNGRNGVIRRAYQKIVQFYTQLVHRSHWNKVMASWRVILANSLPCFAHERPSDIIIDCKAKHHDSHSLHSQEVYRLMIRLSMNSTVAVSLLLIGGTGAVAEVSKVLASRAEN
jgi:hypothetical protein